MSALMMTTLAATAASVRSRASAISAFVLPPMNIRRSMAPSPSFQASRLRLGMTASRFDSDHTSIGLDDALVHPVPRLAKPSLMRFSAAFML